MIINSGVKFKKDAISENPFDTNYFAWTDFSKSYHVISNFIKKVHNST